MTPGSQFLFLRILTGGKYFNQDGLEDWKRKKKMGLEGKNLVKLSL